ncbi:MAG: DUF3237 domain-containing protein [Oscillospiraceae bacterium]|nr:DUF3237 domain-containing protein [Oscillospiraceae bacterium]
MSKQPIMVFQITINPTEISELEGPTGKVKMIPFPGTVDSPLFRGVIRPGAVDVQVTNAAGIRHMCARYFFDGTDATGKPCHLFVDNNGYFEPDSSPSPFRTAPTFLTDSPELAPYLHSAHFRTEGHPREGGVEIRVFDVLQEQE